MQVKRVLTVVTCCLLLFGFSKIYAGPVPGLPNNDKAIHALVKKQTCYACGGSGWATCTTCMGTGRVDGDICSRCGGSGRVYCNVCGGKGYIEVKP